MILATNTNNESNEMTTVEEYTQKKIQEEGEFRVFPVDWTVETSDKTKSIAIAFKLAIRAKWFPENKAWSNDWPAGYFTEHRAWVIGTDGEVNAKTVKRLSECGLWDGDWGEIERPPRSVLVLATVEAEQYEGKDQYRASWLNPNAEEPRIRGQFTPADPGLLNDLRTRFGGKMRAIVGGAPAQPAAAAAPPAGASAAPPPPGAPGAAATPSEPAPSAPAPTATAGAPPAVTPPDVATPESQAPAVTPPPGGAPPNVTPPATTSTDPTPAAGSEGGSVYEDDPPF